MGKDDIICRPDSFAKKVIKIDGVSLDAPQASSFANSLQVQRRFEKVYFYRRRKQGSADRRRLKVPLVRRMTHELQIECRISVRRLLEVLRFRVWMKVTPLQIQGVHRRSSRNRFYRPRETNARCRRRCNVAGMDRWVNARHCGIRKIVHSAKLGVCNGAQLRPRERPASVGDELRALAPKTLLERVQGLYQKLGQVRRRFIRRKLNWGSVVCVVKTRPA